MKTKLIMNTQYIDFYLQENNISKEEFANKCGIGINDLNNIYSQKNVNIDMLVKVTNILKITTDTFLFMEKHQPKKIYML